jgi:hypothetical protein
MSEESKPEIDKQAVLAALPSDVSRIQVKDTEDKIRFRLLDEVRWDDELQFNKHGQPIVMRGSLGRPKDDSRSPIPTVLEEEKDPNVFVPIVKSKGKKSFIKNKAPTAPTQPTIQTPVAVVPATSIPQPTPATSGVLGTIKEDPESVDVLYHVMQGLAEEAEAMAHARLLLESQGKNASNVSAKRVSALRAVGDTWLKRKEQIGSKGVDLNSLAFKRVFTFIMDTFRVSLMVSGVRAEQIEVIFAKLAAKIDDDWMKEAQKKVEGEE